MIDDKDCPQIEERIHHPFSPSTLQSLEACPGYRSKDSTHIRTIMGTLAHKATETRTDDPRLSDDDAVAVAECLDFYDKRLALAKGYPGNVVELLETYLPVDDCVFGDVQSTTAGYVDRVVIYNEGRSADLFDWKFGLWPIEKAENNLQGIAYALGIFREYPLVQECRFFFKQPLLDSIQEAVFTRAQIPALYLRIQTVVARARDCRERITKGDWSKVTPMVPACNFCANLGNCPAVAEFACKVGSKFFPLEIPDNITPTMVMDEAQTVLALRLSQVLGVWAKAFRTMLTDRVVRMDTKVPPGYRLESRAEREIVDPAAYKRVALDFLTEAEYADAMTVSLGAVEEKIQAKAARGQKMASVETFKQKLEAAGATKKGLPYTFLRATATKDQTTKS